jgi:mono/diheme cytochrome c family protein
VKPILLFRLTGCFAVLIFAAFLAALWLGAPRPAMARPEQASGASQAPKGDAANGKKLFDTVGCWQCHGYSAQGGAGPKLAPNPISYPSFSQYIRKPSGEMPPYTGKALPDAHVADIYAFLLTIAKPPDPNSIPLLNEKN